MDLMKSIYRINWGALFLLLTLVGCKGSDVPVPEPLPESSKEPISWHIKSDTSMQSRVLVDDNVLQKACTPYEGGYEKIGVWGEYDIEENGQLSTHVEFDNVPLTFAPKAEETNPYNDWNYPGEARYWNYGGKYKFRACFPQELVTGLMTQMDATILQGGPINTMNLQEDILVAATMVDKTTDNQSGPVELDLKHVFAAIRFKVKAINGFVPSEGEEVTSCWLQNKNNATNLFSPSGYLVHSGNESPEIKWYPYESSTAPMYVWKHKGLSFDTEKILYTPNDGLEGGGYTHNDGWLLIVPQTVKAETLQFCYTLKNAGSHIFSANIPAITYEYGKKYTYVLEITGSETNITLTIKSWNHLDSSYDITI